MSSSHDQGDGAGPGPYQPGPRPGQPPATQGTYAPEENMPRQQAPPDDFYPGQQQGGPGRPDANRDAYGRYGPVPGGAGRPLSYLDGARVGFVGAISGAFTHIFTYRGRASRSAFWWFALFSLIVYGVAGYLSDRSAIGGTILDIVVFLPTIVAGIALSVRRLHDSGRTGWWWWIGFIPVIGGLILLVFYLLPGTYGPNRYNR